MSWVFNHINQHYSEVTLNFTGKMDEDDIILTILVYLDVIGEIDRLCQKAINKELEPTEITPQGTVSLL